MLIIHKKNAIKHWLTISHASSISYTKYINVFFSVKFHFEEISNRTINVNFFSKVLFQKWINV